MIAIYSRPWLDALDSELGARRDIPAGVSLRLGYRIQTDDEPIEYTIVVDEGRARIERSVGEASDVVFDQTYQTAIELATGQITAHEAFMTGRLRVHGDPQKLLAVDTDWLDAAQASLRHRTEFPGDET